MMMKTWGLRIAHHLLLFLTVCFIGWVIVPVVKHWVISKLVVLSPYRTPDLYNGWIKPPVSASFRVYIFNVTNPDEVQQGKLPILSEVGPYHFVESRNKINLVTDEEEDSITYMQHIIFHSAKEDLSVNRPLTEKVTMLNLPFVAAALVSQDLPWPMNEVGRMILAQNGEEESLFVTKTAGEVLFGGTKVPFLAKLDKDLGLQVLPNNSFSLFMKENDTLKGPFTVSRGMRDSASFGQILRFKNRSKMNVWKKGSHCNDIRGSDGSIFPPFLNISKPLRFFNSDICRSSSIVYVRDSEVDGIRAFRYKVTPEIFASSLDSEENSCFCVHIEDEPEKCVKRGAYDASPCHEEGAPFTLSMPHFLAADPTYQGLQGMNPDPKLHDSFIDIEPLTAIQMNGSSKMQVNLMVKPVRGIRSLSKIPDIMFPLLWMDLSFELDPISMGKLRFHLFFAWLADVGGQWILPGLCAFVSVAFLHKTRNRIEIKVIDVSSSTKKSKLKKHFTSIFDKNVKEEVVPFSLDGAEAERNNS